MPAMGSFRSKEDDVAKISLSVYITNFPDSCSAKDLFHYCKQYGHVVDSFIPNKRSKVGKRFGFVRFINVFNEERLVNNLCTVWIGRHKLHANLARFKRTPVSGVKILAKNEGSKMGSSNHMNKQVDVDNGVKVPTSSSNSFAQAVKGDNFSGGVETELCPAVVLDDECLASKDLSKSLLGRVKEFASLANLKVALCNEGFVDIKILYMGELWVMLEFGSQESIKLFRDNVSVGSWFSCIKQAAMDFVTEGRITWVEIEGIPFKLWSNNTFKRIMNRWGVLLDIEDQEETCYHSKRLCIHMKSGRSILENFKIIHRGMVFWVRASETPGWVPDFADESDDDDQEDEMSKDGGFNDHVSGCGGGESEIEEVPDTLFEDDGLVKNEMEEGGKDEQENKSEDPFLIYPLLEKKNNLATNDNISVEEGRVYSADAVKDGSSGKHINRNLKEDSVESVVSGHFKKSMIPRTGGSLLRTTGQLVLVITIYAPHDVSEKQTLWDFLQREISKWNGDVVIIGDFNEVRYKSDRFGSVFNAHGASLFNSFIRSSGLMEVNLGGSTFTWCHKSATKMSKLDRFLVSESFMNNRPNINVITLERYLSDHRPILLRESKVDYGPTPFRFFHYWLEMEGFCKVVENGWKESPCDNFNAMRNLMGKLKHLKKVIRVWNKTSSLNDYKVLYKAALEAVDSRIDKGNGTEDDAKSRVEILNTIQDIDKSQSLDTAPKAHRSVTLQMRFLKTISLQQQGDIECEVEITWRLRRRLWALWTDKALALPACLKSSRCSIIINGSPTEEFQFGKGLKQGDPLAPFLFILIMESLHLSFQRVVDAVPSSVLCSLESCRSRFFNGHDSNSRKASWVKWKTIRALQRERGLESQVICSGIEGYVLNGHGGFIAKTPLYGLELSRRFMGPTEKGIDLKKYMRIKLGDGANTAFWEDSWKRRRLFGIEIAGARFTVASCSEMIDELGLPQAVGICIDSIRCVLCDKGVETSNHLFFSCCLARQVSRLIIRCGGSGAEVCV
ncbi:RNA-directed DNA polymerase, eukaryota [Tanacetum coccineum]